MLGRISVWCSHGTWKSFWASGTLFFSCLTEVLKARLARTGTFWKHNSLWGNSNRTEQVGLYSLYLCLALLFNRWINTTCTILHFVYLKYSEIRKVLIWNLFSYIQCYQLYPWYKSEKGKKNGKCYFWISGWEGCCIGCSLSAYWDELRPHRDLRS